MKALIIPALMLMCPETTLAQETPDPFAGPDKLGPKPIDRTSDKKSSAYLTDELLKALGEERLDGGKKRGSPVLRITVLRSFHAPLIFKWYPGEPLGESSLHVKRLKMVIDEKGEQAYAGLDFNQQLRLRPAQNRLLWTIYNETGFSLLPQLCFTAKEVLDGSEWIYEEADKDGSILLSRRNPVHLPLDKEKEVVVDRLACEMRLTTLAMMLWTLSGVDEEPY